MDRHLQEWLIRKGVDIPIETFLCRFWIEKAHAVNYILSSNDGIDAYDGSDAIHTGRNSTIHTWEEVIEQCLNKNYTLLPLIELNGFISQKFYLLHFSQIDINELSEKQRRNLIAQVANQSITENDFRKTLNLLHGTKDYLLPPSNHEEINNEGAINLSDISLFMFDNFSQVPRIIKLANGNYISIEKNSETSSWTKVYTIRFGIKKDSVPFPIFTGICNLFIRNQSFHFTKLLGVKNTEACMWDLEELRAYISRYYTQDPTISLQSIKKWKIGKFWDWFINTMNRLKWWFYKANIFDAGTNEEWHQVLFIQSINEDKILSQLEMTLFSDDGKNIVYIGALGKDGTKEKFIKAIPGLLARTRDILKGFDKNRPLEIWSFKASRDGTGWVMRKDSVPKIIRRYTLKGHKTK